jgi:hypothetical protein
MKLLFDQNLSFKLCQRLADLFPDSDQVRRLGLDQADDHHTGVMPRRTGLCWFLKTRILQTWPRFTAHHQRSFGCVVAISLLTSLKNFCVIMQKPLPHLERMPSRHVWKYSKGVSEK